MFQRLKKVNAINMTQRERRCYDLIVKMEKEFSWENLLKIKNATFINEEDNQNWQNPYFEAHKAKPSNHSQQDEPDLQAFAGKVQQSRGRNQRNAAGLSDVSMMEIQDGADKLIKQKRGNQGEEEEEKNIKTIEEEDENVSAEKSKKKNKRKSGLIMAT